MLRNLIFLGLIGICLGANCPAWPNNTDTQKNWWPCSSGPVIFSDVNQTDCNGRVLCRIFYFSCELKPRRSNLGNYEYPIHLAKPLLIVTQADNQGHVYSSPGLKQTINFWEWNDSTCTWARNWSLELKFSASIIFSDSHAHFRSPEKPWRLHKWGQVSYPIGKTNSDFRVGLQWCGVNYQDAKGT